MPTTRPPSTSWIASVTRPGRVREVDEPRLRRALGRPPRRARRITGTVRSAKQIPPGPVVSWPTTPSSSGTCSSTTRPSSWPTRIAQKTKSAPSSASSRRSVGAERQPLAALALEPFEHRRDPRRAATRRRRRATTSSSPSRSRAREQRAVDHRHPEAAAAEDRDLHAMHHLDAGRGERPTAGSAGRRVGDDGVEVGRRCRRAPSRASRTWPRRRAGPCASARGDHPALDRHLDHRRVHHEQIISDPARAQEGDVARELAQRVLGEHADERAVVAADAAAEHDELDAGVGQQLLDHGEAARDDRELAAVQVARELERRRADVDHHRLAVGDERRGGAADPVLLGEALDRDLRERRLLALAHRAAVHALEPALERELREVAAHGHLRDVEALRELDHARRSGRCRTASRISSLRCAASIATCLAGAVSGMGTGDVFGSVRTCDAATRPYRSARRFGSAFAALEADFGGARRGLTRRAGRRRVGRTPVFDLARIGATTPGLRHGVLWQIPIVSVVL